MCDWLIRHALQARSSWIGVILDTRNGPSVLGPVTRTTMEGLFQAAELARRPLAVLVSSPTLALFDQFSAVSRSCAPNSSTVTAEPDLANAWMSRRVR